MFWFSAAVLFILTLFAWRMAQEMKADVESSGLRKAYLAAAVCGALGTLCFVAAALIERRTHVMKIIGIGTEIIECVRIGRMIQKHGELFLTDAFTPKEIRHCQKGRNATQHFAAQWAAKEAVLKALGIQSVKGIAWTDLEIRHKAGERSIVHLQGAIKDLAQEIGVNNILVTLAHCRAYATAYALAMED